MAPKHIEKKPVKTTRSEPQSDPDRKARTDSRAGHSRRTAAILRRLGG